MSIIDAIAWLDSHEVEDPDLCGFTEPGWYFWDETQSQCFGPFASWRQAFLDCEGYYKRLEERSSLDG